MYPDLSYLFHDLFGTEMDNWTSIFKTFGLLLASAIGVAAFILYLELKRKAKEGVFQATELKASTQKQLQPINLTLNALIGFLLGYKMGYIFTHFGAFKEDAASVLISLDGNWIWGLGTALLLVVLTFVDSKNRVKKEDSDKVKKIYPHNRIGDITITAAMCGIVGAKVFDLVEHWDEFVKQPYEVIFSGGGLAIYGGLIFGFIGVVTYLRYHKIPTLLVMDAVAPALIISYGVGRMGCHFSGDGDWGIVNANPEPSWWIFPDWAWSYNYPRNVLRAGAPIEGCDGIYCLELTKAVYPTPIYEIILAGLIGLFLWKIRKRIKIAGLLFCIYLILNGIERYSIEIIRINERYASFFNLTQAQIIAIVSFILGVVGVILLLINHKKE
ncbi:MAG: prolipoprotein diacylglyceryl transferase family protein [Bacteroidota bacterium]